MKVLRFCNMMTSLGHEVYLYGGTQNEAQVTEFISIVSEEDHQKWFGHYDWDNDVFNDWNGESDCWRIMNARAVAAIEERKQPWDTVGIIGGHAQKPLSLISKARIVEWGIGYQGVLDNAHHVFESYAWMHTVYGRKQIELGKFFDTVIPNSFDNEDYTFRAKKEDYLLYLGRMTDRKGLEVVRNLVKRGRLVYTAGQGHERVAGAVHVGVVRGQQKADLLANAKALIAPTLYIEPFGGVAVEAMLSGTPAITTDFGAFTETVSHGVSGFRCHTMGEFDTAVEMAEGLDPYKIRKHAERYLTSHVCHEYHGYFTRLDLLSGAGWFG